MLTKGAALQSEAQSASLFYENAAGDAVEVVASKAQLLATQGLINVTTLVCQNAHASSHIPRSRCRHMWAE